MPINAKITMNAKKTQLKMLLTPYNSTNPLFWGMDLVLMNNGKPYQTKPDFPAEFDFFNLWCAKDPINAKKYYER